MTEFVNRFDACEAEIEQGDIFRLQHELRICGGEQFVPAAGELTKAEDQERSPENETDLAEDPIDSTGPFFEDRFRIE